jgi:hypothetical protein
LEGHGKVLLIEPITLSPWTPPGACAPQPAAIAREPITDVYLMSNGWKGDLPAAREPYGRWITVMAHCRDLSVWSYCYNIPMAPARAGYFASVVADRKVIGVINDR